MLTLTSEQVRAAAAWVMTTEDVDSPASVTLTVDPSGELLLAQGDSYATIDAAGVKTFDN